MKVEKETIANEIRNLIPIEKFKEPYHRCYDIMCNALADDVEQSLPKNHFLESADDGLFIVKKEAELEDFEKFVADAKKINTGKDERIPFSEFLENLVNESNRRQLLL